MSKEEVNEAFSITFNNKWRLTADPLNYILQRKVVRKKDKSPYFVTVGYYSKIEDVLNAILDKDLRESNVNSIRAMNKRLKEMRDVIRACAQEVEAQCRTLSGRR